MSTLTSHPTTDWVLETSPSFWRHHRPRARIEGSNYTNAHYINLRQHFSPSQEVCPFLSTRRKEYLGLYKEPIWLSSHCPPSSLTFGPSESKFAPRRSTHGGTITYSFHKRRSARFDSLSDASFLMNETEISTNGNDTWRFPKGTTRVSSSHSTPPSPPFTF